MGMHTYNFHKIMHYTSTHRFFNSWTIDAIAVFVVTPKRSVALGIRIRDPCGLPRGVDTLESVRLPSVHPGA